MLRESRWTSILILIVTPSAALSQYQREFGFVLEDRAILVDDVRVRTTGRAVELPRAEHVSADPGQPCSAAW